mmetsp:Transcript_36672/g.72128  ORF Transcript_36672/g.72128 Transcript_36672/m.72128 type:complete len:109 (+) Transcript_36672:514-840(+)
MTDRQIAREVRDTMKECKRKVNKERNIRLSEHLLASPTSADSTSPGFRMLSWPCHDMQREEKRRGPIDPPVSQSSPPLHTIRSDGPDPFKTGAMQTHRLRKTETSLHS